VWDCSRRFPIAGGKAWSYLALAAGFCLATFTLLAQESSPEELRKLARNPFADTIRLPITVDLYFDTNPNSLAGSDLQVEPLIPLHVSNEWLLIPRIDSLAQEISGRFGLEDTVVTFFLTPVHVGRFIWGAGPALLIPTATDSRFGLGKWGSGPVFVVLSQPKWGSAEILIQNIWSFSGAHDRGPVNQMELQPAFSYNLKKTWYLATGPTITIDWTKPSGERWLVPVGGGAGRTFKLGRQPIDVNLTLYRNFSPLPQFSPKWQFSLQMTLLFTRHR